MRGVAVFLLVAASFPSQGLYARFDASLARPYVAGVPFMPSGACLWAAHPEGWGFSGGVHDDLWTEPGTLGFDLRLSVEGRTLGVDAAHSHLSHVRLSAENSGLRIEGAKWISEDDVMVTELEIRNLGTTARALHAAVDFHFEAASVDQGIARSRMWRFHRRRHLWATASGLDFRLDSGSAERSRFSEAEEPIEQRGSQGEDRKRGASGGKLLGANFGGEADHYARYRLVTQTEGPTVLWVRYALADTAPTQWCIRLRGQEIAARLQCASTGGWGHRAEEWAWAKLEVGTLPAGAHELELRSTGPGNNTNFDGLSLASAAADAPPTLPRPAGTRADGTLEVPPGESRRLTIAHGLASSDLLAERSRLRWTETDSEPLLSRQIADVRRWYESHAPIFRCSDPRLEQMYAHRVYLLRKNWKQLGQGALPETAFAEGRWDSNWYPQVISYGAAHQIREARWMRDPALSEAALRSWALNRKADQVFPSHITAQGPESGQYTDWIASTVMELWASHGNPAFLRSVLPALDANARGWYAVYDQDEDGLLLVDSHWWTGMEFQPSFFAFSDFDLKRDHHLERVDLSAYAAGNCRAVAQGWRILGDVGRAESLEALADRTIQALSTRAWDPESKWYYSLHPTESKRSPVREVIGVYPFYFGLPPKDGGFEAAWSVLIDPEEFWTAWPVASCSQKCAVFGQGDWPGHGRVAACLWNGPTWPHANSLVLSAMGETLRNYPPCALTRSHLWELFSSFTSAQTTPNAPKFPFTGEYYRGDTRQWLTAERDYFHSTWIDVLFGELLGIRPEADGRLVIHPLIPPEALASWSVREVRWRGRSLGLSWESTPPRFTVYLDGRLVHESDRIERLELPR